MNANFKIKNFRIFDAEGAEFELSPITILTGCNSSGKSSLVKALVLLSDCLNKLGEEYVSRGDFRLENCCIDFSSLKNLTMGRFDKVLNRSAEKGSAITFAYTVMSRYLAEEICVELSFVAQESDELNRGWLSAISFKKSSGEVILSGYVDDNKSFKINMVNLACVKSNFFDWATSTCGLNFQTHSYSIPDPYFGLITGEDVVLDGVCDRHDIINKIYPQVLTYLNKLNISDIAKDGYNELMNENTIIDGKEVLLIWDLLSKSFETKTIFFLPIVFKLSSLSKKECVSYIYKLGEKYRSRSVNKIAEKFMSSDYESFGEYYLAMEDNDGLIFDKDKVSLSFCGNETSSFLENVRELVTVDSMDFYNLKLEEDFLKIEGARIVTEEEIVAEEESRKKYIEKFERTLERMTFSMIFQALVEVNAREDEQSLDKYMNKEDLFSAGVMMNRWHKLYDVFKIYLKSALIEMISPEHLINTKYVGSNRINVQRLYSFDGDNSDFGRLLKRYFNAKKSYKGIYAINSFVNSWLQKFGVCESVEIKVTEEGFGAIIYLNNNGGKTLLADEGYGISQLISVILEIEVAILEAKTVADDGSKYKPQTIAIEEPEVHLHPRYQSMLADMFMEAYKEYNIRFIIETHSEYLIRKTQVFVAKQGYTEETLKDNPISVFYIGEDHQSQKMIYRADGKFSNEFGAGFYDEASNLAFEIF